MGAVASVMSTVLCCACTGLSCACSFMGCCIGTASSAAGGISAYTARYFYILLLGLIAVACFVLRYEADDWALHINGWDVGCSNSTSKVNVNPLSSDGWYAYCQGDSAVYRLCAAVCIFHFIHLPFALCGSGFHRGFWFWKLLLLFGGIVGFMFIPADDFNDYGFVVTAQATSFFFIVLQLFILVGWFYAWNDKWTDNVYVNGGNENCWLAMILLCSLGMYIAAFAGIALLFIGYKCSLARAITSVTVISIVLITILTLFRDRYANGEPGSILPAAGVSLYITFIAWSALELNHDLDCKPLSIQNDEDAWLQTVVSMLFLAVSMMWLASQHFNSVVGFFSGKATVNSHHTPSSGEESSGLVYESNEKSQVQGNESNPTRNKRKVGEATGTAVFHTSMIFVVLYLSMVVTNWGETLVTFEGENLGNRQLWIKIASQWVGILLFIWTLIAPAVLTNRDFSTPAVDSRRPSGSTSTNAATSNSIRMV